MSKRFNTGHRAVVDMPTDPNHEREGPIVKQSDDDPYAEVWFENERVRYHDRNLRNTEGERLTRKQIENLQPVPHRLADGVPPPDDSEYID